MKRLSFLFALLLMFCLVPALSVRAGEELSTEQQVVDLFLEEKEKGSEEFEFDCDKQLFDKLMADNANRLFILEIKGGIADSSIRYYEDTHVIKLSRVEYTDDPWAECSTEKKAGKAVRDMLKEGYTKFTLIATPALSQKLAGSGNLKNYAAQEGYISAYFSYYQSGIITMSGAEKMEYPYAAVEDAAQFDAAIEVFAADETEEFYIVFKPSFYEELSEDDGLDILNETSMLDSFGWVTAGVPAMLDYYRVTYTDEPCLVCRSDEDMIEAISRMGAVGITDFRLYMVGDEFREAVLADSLQHLHELEVQAGMSSASTAYSRTTIYYSDAKIVSDAVSLETLEDAIGYMTEKTSEAAEDITLFCTEDLFTTLIGKAGGFSFQQDGMDPIYDLLAQSGIYDYDVSTNRTTGAVVIHVNSYYPGQEILRALENETEDELPERLQETLESARELAEACENEDPVETARAIHDALCERIVYTDDDETDEDDTAIGALLNGEANCDGYSDAFLLAGTLAGLDVRYQHGDSLVQGSSIISFGDSVTHMWNLILVDDTWRMVDVTWDDDEEGIDYTWFNIGADRASRTHTWNEEMTVEMLEETDLSGRPDTEFRILSEEDLNDALNTVFSNGMTYASLIFDDEEYTDYEAALDYVRNHIDHQYYYSWGKEMRQLRLYLD
ncbi:MAG: hypothetical protein IJL78_11260 [Lachnospiraceae bacterium]|nr:hypothetical protein [Lachnospiraceae bacterium]